jgi:hypothetical protein
MEEPQSATIEAQHAISASLISVVARQFAERPRLKATRSAHRTRWVFRLRNVGMLD